MYRPNKPSGLTFAEMARARSAERAVGTAPDLTTAAEVDSRPDSGKKVTATTDESKSTESVDALHEPFSAELHKSRFDEGYFELARAVRDDGNEPNDLQSWQDAVALRQKMAVTVAQFNRTRVVAGDARTRGEQTRNDLAEKIKQLSARFMDEVLPRVVAESHERILEKEKNTPIAAADALEHSKPASVETRVENQTQGESETSLRTTVEALRKRMEDAGMDSMELEHGGAGESLAEEANDPHDSWASASPAEMPIDDPHDSWGGVYPAVLPMDYHPAGQSAVIADKKSKDGEAVARKIRAEKLNRADGKAELAGVNTERDALLAAERDLQTRESQFIGGHSALGRSVQNIFLTKKSRELQGAEAAVDQKAAEYHQALEKSLAARLVAKGFTPGTPEFEKVAQRYRERVASKDIIDRGERSRTENRTAALEQKGSNAFEKSLHVLASMNAGLEKRLGKFGARGARIVASATVASVVASFLAPLSAVAIASYAASRVGRSAIGAVAGSSAGAGAGSLYGVYQKANFEKTQEKLKADRGQAIHSANDFADMREAYRAGNTETMERKRRNVEMLVAALVGGTASFGTAYAEALMASPSIPWLPPAVPGVERAPGVIAAPSEFHFEPGAQPNHPQIVDGPPPAELAPSALSPDATSPVAPPVEAAPAAVPPAETLATVNATPGHGYEYMLKRLSEQLHAQHTDVSQLDHASDAYKLATASPHDINTVVHQIASDPAHNFFRGPDGSVRIGLNADLSVNANGAIEFNDGMGHLYVQAPPDAPLTPSVTHAPAGAHADGVPSEAQVQQTAERLRAWHAANPGVPDMTPHIDAAGDVYGPPGAHTVDPPWTIEHPSASVFSHAVESFTNPHGVEVNLSQPHVYAMAGGKIIVEGGGYDDRLQVAIGYVQQHGGSVQVEAKVPVRVGGVLTRYLETVKKSGPFGLGGHIETSRLAGAPRAVDVLSDSRERFATRFIKKLQ